jgi:hypothetical protein
MMTNSPAQQTTRRMTAEQKAAAIQARIAADTAARHAWEAERTATAAMWTAAYAAGLDANARHALTLRLMAGATPDQLRAELAQRQTT